MKRWWRAAEDLFDPRGRTSPARYRDRLLGIFGVWGVTGMAAFWWEALDGVTLAWIWGVLCVMIAVLRERRLHDTGHSGWWLLLAFVPIIGSLVLLWWYVSPSEQGENRFGPQPPETLA